MKTATAPILKIFVLSFLAPLVIGQAGKAEDDIVSILDGKESPVVIEAEKKTWSSLISNPTAEQRIFLEFAHQGKWKQALFQWHSAFSNSKWPESASGRALWGFLLAKNGLSITGFEHLFSVAEPKQIHPDVIALWKELGQSKNPAWQRASLTWSDAWTPIFGEGVEIQVRARPRVDAYSTEELEALLRKTAPETELRSWVEWSLVLGIAEKGEMGRSAKLLKHLMSTNQRLVTTDHLHLTAARMLYEQGYLDAAIEYDQKIPKKSDFWLEAQEEMAWAYLRKGQPQNAISKLETVVSPLFRTQVGPESIFLKTLAHLKVCDYPAVAKLLQEYRQRYQPRSKTLQGHAENPGAPTAHQLLDRMKHGRVAWTELGEVANALPRFAARDEVLFDLAQAAGAWDLEAKEAAELYSGSLAEPGGVGFQAHFEQLKAQAGDRRHMSESVFFSRLSQLARVEVDEIQKVLQKMHIVEAEVLSQIELAGRLIRESNGPAIERKADAKVKANETVKFPFEGELWLDELSHYQVDFKGGCQALRSGEKL